MMDTKFARRLIEQPGAATTKALFEGGHPGFFWVDWREADQDIVRMVGDTIAEALTTAWSGTRLQIGYRGQITEVPLSARPGEQDLTLAGLNQALAGQFEIRYVAASEGGDTIAFLVLPQDQWRDLINEFGDAAVQRALPELDPQQPLFGGEEISKEEVAAQIERANPGVLGRLKLGRAAFRLITTAAAERLRAQHARSPDTMPVLRPLCGDLVVSYFDDMLTSSEVITEGDLRRHNVNRDELHALALDHTSQAWRAFSHRPQGGLSTLRAQERVDNSSIALFDAYWENQAGETGPLVAAVPRRDLMLFVRADDADGIAILLEAIKGVDRADANALSTQLFSWTDGGWAVRELRGDEREFTQTELYLAAETGDYTALYALAYTYQLCGRPDKAAPIYRRGGEQAEAKRVYSPNMFANGSAMLCNLADLYEHGNGVPQDYAEAHAWYRRSASLDNFVAEYSLGNLYLNGQGVQRDVEQAKYWLSRSAAQGYAPARKARAELK